MQRASLSHLSISAVFCCTLHLSGLTAQDSWQGIPVSGPPPMAEHVAAFDSGRGRLVVLSSLGSGPATTHEFDGSAWVSRTTTNAPAARSGAAMVYDGARGKIVLYGGNFSDEHWEYDGADWSRRLFTAAPEARSWHGLAYDVARNRIVLFGGLPACFCGLRQDTWEFDGVQWQQRMPTTVPEGRRGQMMTFDSLRGRTVMFGGFRSTTWFQPPPGHFLDDTWEWDGTDWREVTTMPRPAARMGGGFAFDPVRGVSVLFGGYTMPILLGGTAVQDTWEYGADGWRQLSPLASPAARYGAILCHDTVGSRLLLHGGADEVVAPTQVFGDLHGLQGGPAGTATVYGSGCGTSPGLRMTAASLPRVGRNLVLDWAGMPAGATTFLLVGGSRTTYAGLSLPLGLGTLGFPLCQLECAMDLVVPIATTGTWARASFPTPDAFGQSVYLQSLALGTTSLSMTPGLALAVGR